MRISASNLEEAIKKYEQVMEKMREEVPDFLKDGYVSPENVSHETSEEEKEVSED